MCSVEQSIVVGLGLILATTTGSIAASSNGTGIVVSTRGHVLTNAHVVKGCLSATVRVPGEAGAAATIIASSEADDLAILQTSVFIQHAAEFRITPPVRSGETAVVYGFPLSGVLSSTGSATTGTINALAGLRNNAAEFQISAPVQPGNSGGPLLDSKGNVIGVVVAKLDALRVAKITEDIPQNVNFALKASVATNFMDAQSVPYTNATATDELPVPDIVERAKSFTVHVRCESVAVSNASMPTSPGPQPSPPPASASAPATSASLRDRSLTFVRVVNYQMSAANPEVLKLLDVLYGERVTYYGDDLPKSVVIEKIARFLERWPARQYREQDPVSVECNEPAMQCRVRGVLLFDSRSPLRGQRSHGTADFDYLLQYIPGRAAPMILTENGKVIERQVERLPQWSTPSFDPHRPR